MWGTELNKNLGKICLFTVLSYFGISSAYSAPLTTSIADTATRFEVIAVDTPSIPKGGVVYKQQTLKILELRRQVL